METFDLAWNSTADVRTTLGEKASAAWTDFLATIEPIRTPLMVAGGILVLLSPLGPIVVLTEVIPPLWEKVTWLWNNWNSEDILVSAQKVLREDILPRIIGAVSGVASALAGASAWLAGLVTRLSTALTGVLGAFGGIRCLAAVTTYLEGVSAQFERLAAWANSEFEGLGPALQAVLDALGGDPSGRSSTSSCAWRWWHSAPACCRSSSPPRSGCCVPTASSRRSSTSSSTC